jgi:hypothetical protein
VSFPEAARAVFRFHTKDFPDKKQYVWPVAANTLSMAEAVKQRRQTRNRQKAIKNYASPKPANTSKRSRAKKRGTTAKAS